MFIYTMFKFWKHIIQVMTLYTWLGYNIHLSLSRNLFPEFSNDNDISTNNTLMTLAPKESKSAPSKGLYFNFNWSVMSNLMLIMNSLNILPLPQILCNLLGLTFFNTFPGDVKLKKFSREGTKCSLHDLDNHSSTSTTRPENSKQDKNILEDTPTSGIPHLCFRVVTRGDYPDLVQRNLHKNFLTCLEAGLINFSYEVVTDKNINLTIDPIDNRVRQLIVPGNYKTSSGALFKARALQYALEPGVSPLKPGDYIVHLDEETILTENVINGISNFALDGRYAFGQGLITYGNTGIFNILTTMADSYRVADDMGKVRFQLAALHKPIFGWKGSFVVSKYEAELDVSYDHGPDGSIAEDCYFSMVAMNKGYKFDFIEGEMFEKSPFTIVDFTKQRRRWIQGIWLVVHSGKIPIKTKLFLIFSLYAGLTLPIISINIILNIIIETPVPVFTKILGDIAAAITLHMYFFGLMKTFDVKPKPFPMLILYLLVQSTTLTFSFVVENIAVIWGLCSSKHQFYVVEKEFDRKIMLDS